MQVHLSLQLQQEQMAKDAQDYAAALDEAVSASSDAGVEHSLEDQARALAVWTRILPGDEDMGNILDDGMNCRIQDLEAEINVLWRNIVPLTARKGCVFFSSLSFLTPLCSLHDVATAQATPWFPAFLVCLQNAEWPIPGFSPWMSRRGRTFMEEKRASNFWTFHRPVAAVVDSAIQQTWYVFCSRFFYVLTAFSCR
jgi:hypothetical protein